MPHSAVPCICQVANRFRGNFWRHYTCFHHNSPQRVGDKYQRTMDLVIASTSISLCPLHISYFRLLSSNAEAMDGYDTNERLVSKNRLINSISQLPDLQ